MPSRHPPRSGGQLVVEFLNLGLHLFEVGKGLTRFLKDGTTIFGHQMLGQVTYGAILGNIDRTARWGTHASNDFEQGRFARTVLTHQGNTVLLIDDKRNILE